MALKALWDIKSVHVRVGTGWQWLVQFAYFGQTRVLVSFVLPHSLKSWGGGHQSHMAGSEVDLEAALPSFPCHGAYPKSEWKNHLSFEPYYHGLCSFSKRWKRNFELPFKICPITFFSYFSLLSFLAAKKVALTETKETKDNYEKRREKNHCLDFLYIFETVTPSKATCMSSSRRPMVMFVCLF